ncbi:MAG: hypothetical protein LAQ30_30550, partial [Acidobacteriia bacterium]|nr:hypothetical protein [Terriglobia bacterium]
MRRLRSLVLSVLCLAALLPARHGTQSSCGTSRENTSARLFLHRQSVRARSGIHPLAAVASTSYDSGNIAVLDDAGVVSRLNEFNLDLRTLIFEPAAAGGAPYRYSVAERGYDADAAAKGAPLAALDDD